MISLRVSWLCPVLLTLTSLVAVPSGTASAIRVQNGTDATIGYRPLTQADFHGAPPPEGAPEPAVSATGVAVTYVSHNQQASDGTWSATVTDLTYTSFFDPSQSGW